MADYAPPDRPALDEWLAQAPPPPPPPRSMSSSLAEGLSPYVQDASEAAATRVRAPYARAEARESGLPSLLGHYGEKIKSVLTAPQRALTGELQVNDPETNMPTREAIGEAGSLAGILMGGGMPMAEKGALGMFGGRPTYSAAAEAARTAKLQTGTPDQWLGYLKNYQGVKPSELEEVGLEPWLKSRPGKVTRDEVNQYIESKQPQVREARKGDLPEDEILHQSGIKKDDWDKMSQSQKEVILAGFPKEPTKYSSYQLPGGSNYGETLLTLPTANDRYTGFLDQMRAKYGDKPYGQMPLTPEESAYIDKQINAYGNGNADVYKSSHWDEPNVFLHVRHNDRTVPGPNGEPLNSLHLEELQSDWHQAGRKQGYNNPEAAKAAKEKLDKAGYPDSNEDALMAQRDGVLTQDEYRSLRNRGVPDAPFKQTWPDLALKRMLHRAATETNPDGTPKYHALSWTPGEAQAARYDLSKQIDDLRVVRSVGAGNHYTLDAKLKGRGEHTRIADSVPEDKLADHVGKDMAEKIVKDIDEAQNNRWGVKNRASGNWGPRYSSREEAAAYQQSLPESVRSKTDILEMAPKYAKEYSGLDLKVGGEGMKAFYDKMLVDKANALTKKYGAKVKQSTVDENKTNTRPKYGQNPNYTVKHPVHVLHITPELRAAAMKGFPTFAIGGAAVLGTARNRNDR